MRVFLPFAFYGMLRQSNDVPSSGAVFDLSWHTCSAYILTALSGLLNIIQWSNARQAVGNNHLLPIPAGELASS